MALNKGATNISEASESLETQLASTTMAEIAENLPQIAEWKKQQKLPPEYGNIEERGDWWIIRKRVDLSPLVVLPFRGVDFTIAVDPATKKFHIFEIAYPKAAYDREYVEKMAYITTNCPYCVSGTDFVLFPAFAKFIKQKVNPFEQPSEANKMVQALENIGKWFGINKGELSATGLLASSVLSSAVNAGLLEATNSGGRLVARLALGIGTLATSPIISLIKKRPPTGKMAFAMQIASLFGIDMLKHIPEPSAGSYALGMKEAWQDLKRARASLMGYGPVEAIKQLLNPNLASRLGGSPHGPKALIPYRRGLMPFDQDLTGHALERVAVPPLQKETQQIGPLAGIFTRKTVG